GPVHNTGPAHGKGQVRGPGETQKLQDLRHKLQTHGAEGRGLDGTGFAYNEGYAPLWTLHLHGRLAMAAHTNTRREFLHSTVAGTAALGLGAALAGADDAGSKGLPTRPLGRTGQNVSILCLGGWHIGAVKDQNETVKIMHAAVDEGLTFFDNCWD